MSTDSSFNRIGEPPLQNSIPQGDQMRDTQQGNPLGDKVENTAGHIAVDGRAGGNAIRPTRQQSVGANLRMYSKPSWLSGLGMDVHY